MNLDTFCALGNTVHINATTATGNVAFDANVEVDDVRIRNPLGVDGFIVFGPDSTLAASLTTSMPIAPGTEILKAPRGTKYVAAILPSGSGTVYFTPGRGI